MWRKTSLLKSRDNGGFAESLVQHPGMGCGKRNSLNHREHGGPQGKNHREKLDALASPASLFFWFFLFLDCHVFSIHWTRTRLHIS